MYRKGSEKWGINIARNPNTPVETLVELSRNEDVYIRMRVADNPNTPVETLIELSRDNDNDVCTFVERNQKSQTEEFKKLKLAYETMNIYGKD